MDRSARSFLIVASIVAAVLLILNLVARRADLTESWLALLLIALAVLLAVWDWLRPAAPAEAAHSPSFDPVPAEAVVKSPALRLTPPPASEEVVENPALKLTTPPAPELPDDLEIIEGIGPKMNAALQAAGIHTFAQVAQSTPEQLHAAIEAAGMRFAPSLTTWAEQAALAAHGDWEGLKQLQLTLTAGRRDKA